MVFGYVFGKRKTTLEGGYRALQQVSVLTRRRCAAKPAYVDDRGFALTTIYGIKPDKLGMYPPAVYSLDMAREDVRLCAQGRPLRWSSKVIKYDKVAGRQDPRVYALMKFHGYTPAELADGSVLRMLPYSEKDAQIDISTFAKKGRKYYTVIKPLLQVVDPKKLMLRDWRDKGFDDKYRYSPYNPRGKEGKVKTLWNAPESKYGATLDKYPLQKYGGKWVRMVKCRDIPDICPPGLLPDDVFPYANSRVRKRDPKDRAPSVESQRAAASRGSSGRSSGSTPMPGTPSVSAQRSARNSAARGAAASLGRSASSASSASSPAAPGAAPGAASWSAARASKLAERNLQRRHQAAMGQAGANKAALRARYQANLQRLRAGR